MSKELTAIKKAMDQMVKVRMVAEEAISLLEEAYAVNPIIKNSVRHYQSLTETEQTRLTIDKQTKRINK